MFSLLPWSVKTKNEKVIPGVAKVHTEEQHEPAIMNTNQASSKAKRKRRESNASGISPTNCISPAKRKPEFMSHVEVARRPGDLNMTAIEIRDQFRVQNTNGTSLQRNNVEMELDKANNHHTPAGIIAPQDGPERGNPETRMEVNTNVADALTMTSLQETIGTQFSLEILLKHNELRLIDQELAKCQIALEQLRRCALIPYPVLTANASDMLAVNNGVGSAYGLSKMAQSPAPWGVTDGPYTKHYSRWLIPDPTFDGDKPGDARAHRPTGKRLPERTTRGLKGDKTAPAFMSRSQRGSTGSRLQALPAGYPEPKEEKGPMIVKRSTDGRMVKLVCLDCRRENFNSAQGFINHCRIAHSRGFASHDAAALACGEEIEYNEAGGVISDCGGGTPANAGLVHPLIRSAHVAALASSSSAPKRRKLHSKSNSSSHASEVSNHVQNHAPQSSSSIVLPQSDSFVYIPFVPSPHTPHLSALFAKVGRGGDLNAIVSEATTKTDIDTSIPSDEEDEDEEMEDAPEGDKSRSTRGLIHNVPVPTRRVMSPAPLEPTTTNKSAEKQAQIPGNLNNVSRIDHASPYTSHESAPSNNTVLLSASPPINLSPNTIESNPAPSLVSDDEDDYEDPHSESEALSSEAEDTEDRYVVEVDDEEEVSGSSVDHELATAVKARAHPASRRRSVLRSAVPMDHGRAQDNRRVSFRSPIRENKAGGKKGR